MSNLSDSLAGKVREQGDRDIVLAIYDIIKDAMYPFEAGGISVWLEDRDFATGAKSVAIQIKVLPDNYFRYAIDDSTIANVRYPELLYRHIGRMAAEFFSQIYIPPSSNCQLGEN